jgi:hypothetical protein
VLLSGGVLLIAAHVVVLRHAVAHVRLSREMLAIVIVLVVLKHLGVFGPVYAIVRRRFRR